MSCYLLYGSSLSKFSATREILCQNGGVINGIRTTTIISGTTFTNLE